MEFQDIYFEKETNSILHYNISKAELETGKDQTTRKRKVKYYKEFEVA